MPSKPSGAPNLTAQLGLSGQYVQFSVCKSSGTFSNDLKVEVGDWITGYYISTTINPTGGSCSNWITLNINYGAVKTNTVLQNQAVRVISPASCASKFDSGCNPTGGSCGYCWAGSTGKALTATCKWK
ncbi:MAG: hypothetical protein FJ100_17700 [Deltaproteobacteria bacterium]|nr:hypothetical protein [Deltaproteobacteria bacterium]